MMLNHHIFKTVLLSTISPLVTLSVFTCLSSTSLAQTEAAPASETSAEKATDPATLTIQQCIALMEQEKWYEARTLTDTLIAKHNDTGVSKFGAKFATAYYYRGLSLLKIAQSEEKQAAIKTYQSAIQSFDQCYAVDIPKDSGNTYRIKSLLLRGNAQQALEQFQAAEDSYTKFLNERSTGRDPYSLSDFNINLSICIWKNAKQNKTQNSQQELKTQEAINLIKDALTYSGRNTPTPSSLITGIHALTEISAELKNDEIIPKIIQHVHSRIPKNLDITRNPDVTLSAKIELSNNLDNLSNLSKIILVTSIKELPKTSYQLTTIFPGIEQYATELHLQKSELLGISDSTKPYLQYKTLPQEQLEQFNQLIQNVLKARSITLQSSDDPDELHAAVGLYQFLLQKFPNASQPEKDLYGLIHVAAKSGHPADASIAITSAKEFLTKYPDHELYKPTQTLYLSAIYQDQQYQEALTLANEIILQENSDTQNSNILQSADFIRAAAHYYLGDYSNAETLLKQHASTYPAGNPAHLYTSDVAYLRAALQNQLLNWDSSVPQLKAFIQKHTEANSKSSIYTPFAYYDVAFALYSQGKTHSAILSLKPFALNSSFDVPVINPLDNLYHSSELRRSQIAPSAAILLGNIRITLSEQNEAVAHYADAIQLAKRNGNQAARDEAYYHIINTLGKRLWNGIINPRLAETLTYYQEFIALPNAKNSPYYTQILTSSITALEKSNPEEPVVLTLEKTLFLHNNTPNIAGVETALKTYLYYQRKDDTPASEIIRILTDDVKTTNSPYHKSLIIVAQLEILERERDFIRVQGSPDLTALAGAEQQIAQHYQDLISTYRPVDLDNFTLLKIATHLTVTNKGENANQSQEYFKAIIDQPSTIKQTEANLGLALLNANSNKPEKKILAKTQLAEIIDNPFTSTQAKATAHYHLISLLLDESTPNWADIETQSTTYLKYPQSVKDHNLDVLNTLAHSYDKQSKIDETINIYTQIWATSMFSIQHSAPAIERVCELLWERNNPAVAGINAGKSDRQLAYETAYKYIRKTKDHFNKRKDALPATAKTTWANVKTLATKTYPLDQTISPFQGQP